ncbi:MAG: rRNA maturation RNase YbeY [Bacteroidota bacterium]
MLAKILIGITARGWLSFVKKKMSAGSIGFFKEGVRFRLSAKNQLADWLMKSIRKEAFRAGTINIVFCGDRYLRTMNKRFLGHDYNTDIITFPTGEDPSVIDGDLFISIESVRKNAETFKVTFQDELHRVIIHGILHLCNYSDKSERKKKEMRAREDHYLNRRSWLKK